MSLLLNKSALRGAALAPPVAESLGPDGLAAVRDWLEACPRHAETPLVNLPSIAREASVASVHLKDESDRLGLASFKSLGGAYAVLRVVAAELGRRLGRLIGPGEIIAPAVRGLAESMTICCATDGNHGRSVAAGARICGARAVIYVHQGVSEERVAAIARYGAHVERVAGSYDDSVAHAAAMCADHGWMLVADTGADMTDPVPLLVMQGYTAMAAEAFDRLDDTPTHIFLQAGVGGMAAAIAAYVAARFPDARPKIVIVEPDRAACLQASCRAGALTAIAPGEPTVMAMLECYEPSHVAWHVLERTTDAFLAIDDQSAIGAMRRLAAPVEGEPVIVAGESGGAGLAGLLVVAGNEAMRRDLGVDATSRILLINTEGATAPGLYARLIAGA